MNAKEGGYPMTDHADEIRNLPPATIGTLVTDQGDSKVQLLQACLDFLVNHSYLFRDSFSVDQGRDLLRIATLNPDRLLHDWEFVLMYEEFLTNHIYPLMFNLAPPDGFFGPNPLNTNQWGYWSMACLPTEDEFFGDDELTSEGPDDDYHPPSYLH